MRAICLLIPFLSLTACNPWENLPLDGWSYLDAPLWDDAVVAAEDGLYVRLPHAGELIRLTATGEVTPVDLGGAAPTGMALGPDDATLVVFQDATSCVTEEEDVDELSECPEEDLVVDHQLSLVRGGKLIGENGPVSIPGFYNRLVFSPWDPTSAVEPVAVAYLDYEGENIDVDGVLNLTEVLMVNLQTGATSSVSVGFSANNVLFTRDGARAAVLSRSQVVVVDLTTSPYEILVTYNLTLDADQQVDPLGAALTPDDRYLLMSVVGSSDLYVMDLDNESINIVDLDAAPAAMAVDAGADRTALVYANKSQVDILEHEHFDVETVELDEPCNTIVDGGDGVAVLYNRNATTHDVYRLDLTTGDVVEYRLANPVTELRLTEDGGFAVALMRPEGSGGGGGIDAYFDTHWGLSILDLSDDDNLDLVLESQPVGLAFAVGTSGEPYALLLLTGMDSLVQVGLWTATVSEVPLPAPATGIGALPDGVFYITHAAALGLISFLAPGGAEVSTASGFATEGFLTDDSLPEPVEE
jgi:hypothetical protein